MLERLKRFFGYHWRCLSFEAVNLLFNHDWLFGRLGRWNRRRSLVKSVFLTYPANRDYASAYAYSWRLKVANWQPHLAGIFRQNGKWGVMFVVSAANEEFRDPDNFSKLKALCLRMEQLRQIFAAERKTFGGILPAVLGKARLVKEMPELETTIAVVAESLFQIRIIEELEFATPVLLLVSSQSLASRVREKIDNRCGETIYVQARDLDQADLSAIKGRRTLLINLAAGEDLERLADQCWPEVIVLNEAYLRNLRELKQKFSGLGCKFYQIAGVRGRAYPRLPGVYSEAIPCCQAWIDPHLVPVIKRII